MRFQVSELAKAVQVDSLDHNNDHIGAALTAVNTFFVRNPDVLVCTLEHWTISDKKEVIGYIVNPKYTNIISDVHMAMDRFMQQRELHGEIDFSQK